MLCDVGGLFLFQAEDGIRDLVRSRGLGDVYKRQPRGDAQDPARPGRGCCQAGSAVVQKEEDHGSGRREGQRAQSQRVGRYHGCLLYTSDAADERSSVDLGGRRIIKQKKN